MTSKNDKLRGLFLAALMVLSITVGSIAFAGTAAADDHPTVTSAIEFDGTDMANEFNGSSGDVSTIEVAFDQAVRMDDGTNITSGDYEVFVNDTNATLDYSLISHGNVSGTEGQVVLTSSTALAPNDDLVLNFTDKIEDVDGNNATFTNESVSVTGATISEAGTQSYTEYAGTQVAYVANTSALDTSFEISAGDELILDGSTGTGSQVYLFDSGDRDTSVTHYFDNTANNVSLDLRNLNLEATLADDTADGIYVDEDDNADDTVVDVSAVRGNEKVEVQVLDSDGDDFGDAQEFPLDGSGEVEANLGDVFDYADTGTYTLEVTDVDTGVTAETDSFDVEKVPDVEASFTQSQFEQERGDIINITVDISEGDSGTVFIGDSGANYGAEVDITDGSEDGEVIISMNTYKANDAANTFWNPVDNDDTVEHEEWKHGGGDVDKPLAAIGYDLNVTTGDEDGEELAVGAMSLTERSTTGVTVHEAPEGTVEEVSDISEYATAGSETADGEQVLLQIEASGFEGNFEWKDLDARSLNETQAAEGLNVTVEQTNAGNNAEAVSINESNSTLLTDFANDQFFLVFDTVNDSKFDFAADDEYEATFTIDETSPFVTDSTDSVDKEEYTASFSLVAEDTTVSNLNDSDVLNVEAAEEVTVSGDTTLAPNRNISVEIRSSGNYLMSDNKVPVQDDGTWSTTFDFSDKAETSFEVTAEGRTEDGYVMEAAPEETTTEEVTETTTEEPEPTTTEEPEPTTTEEPEPTTTEEPVDTTTEEPPETTTETPGFTMGLALIALLGAALLALRREL